MTTRRVSARCPENRVIARHRSQRVDNEFALARLDTSFERLYGVSWKHRDPLLTHDGPGVVLGIDEVHGDTGSDSPAARTASNTRFPNIPCPPNLGSSAGWVFRMRAGNVASVRGPRRFM